MKKVFLLISIFFCLGIGTSRAQLTDMITFPTGWPYGSLTLTHKLYGMTSESGLYSKGVIFSIDTDAHNYKTLHDFDKTDGAGPGGSLTLSGTKFFGMTNTGGKNGPNGEGVIFTMDTNGNNYKVLFNFCCTNGYFPEGDVTLTGSKLYGMAQDGGAHSSGVIFAMDTNGSNYKILFNFNDSIGSGPAGDLTLSGTKFYGMTESGGKDYKGVIFSIDTNGHNYKILLQFNDTNGGYPYSSLTLLGDKLYGGASYGGAYNDGVIFTIDTNGSNYRIIHNFDGADGSDPWGVLNLSGGVLYGMAAGGGTYGYGVIYSIDTNGTNYSVLFNFNGGDGGSPRGGLTISGDVFYGLTYYGPDAYHGLAFKFYDTTMHLSIVGVNETCTGANNGYASTNAGGGYTPYTYSWAPVGKSTDTVTGLSIGTYTVTVKDIHGHIQTDSVTINPPAPLVVLANAVSNVLCNGNLTGKASAKVSGGTSPYTYSWAPTGGSGSTASYLSAGVYTVTVHDSCSSSALATVTITQPNVLNVSANITSSILCNGESNGVISATVSGGASPYTYLWSNSDTSPNITGLSAGTYTLQVIDNHECTGSATATITQPTILSLSVQITANELCNGEGNGSASSTVSGGISPYTYLWNNGETTSAASNLYIGLYQLIVTDNNGCITSASITITQPPAITIIPNSTPDTGNGNGSAWVNTSGGTTPYTYLWSPGGSTTDSIFGQLAGKYCCMVTDANGCKDNECVTINSDAGINNLLSNSDGITVYPNPGKGVFILQANSQQPIANSHIEIYNVLGEKVYSNNYQPVANGYQLSLSNQPNGVYFYRVITGNGNLVGEGKLVIEK